MSLLNRFFGTQESTCSTIHLSFERPLQFRMKEAFQMKRVALTILNTWICFLPLCMLEVGEVVPETYTLLSFPHRCWKWTVTALAYCSYSKVSNRQQTGWRHFLSLALYLFGFIRAWMLSCMFWHFCICPWISGVTDSNLIFVFIIVLVLLVYCVMVCIACNQSLFNIPLS